MAAPAEHAASHAKRPPPPPPLAGLRKQYARDPLRLQKLGEEIYETWDRMSGPAARPADGYKVTVANRVTAAPNEATTLENGSEILMLFSMFSARFLEYASIEAAGDMRDVHLWERYNVPWGDAWPGVPADWPKEKWLPIGARCVRDAAAVDAFTAYFLGLAQDSVPVRAETYRAAYDPVTGLVVSISFTVATERQTDAEYAAMQDFMMEVVANAVTARESSWHQVDRNLKELRGNSAAAFAGVVAEEMSRATGIAVEPAARQRLQDMVQTAMRHDWPAPPPTEAHIEEID